MKKIVSALIGILWLVKVSSQTNTYPFPSSGNVGIGTTSPSGLLHLYNATSNPFIKIQGSSSTEASYLQLSDGVSEGYLLKNSSTSTTNATNPGSLYTYVTTGYDFQHIEGGVPRFTIRHGGNVGVGTTDPVSPFQVGTVANMQTAAGLAEFTGNLYFDGTAWRYITSNYGGLTSIDPNTGSVGFYTASTGTAGALASSLSAKMFILNNGNVGIGTNSPTEKLFLVGNAKINGNVTAKKITVTQSDWSDYVFDEDYKLKDLKSIEAFIKANKHLPEVPSVKDVNKNGINIGDTQALLLKKIEELTLYIIEMNKKVALLEKKIFDK